MDPLQNHSKTPLVTTVVVTHPGDVHLLGRALTSLHGQLPQGQHEVIVMHDGPMTPETERHVEFVDKLPGKPFDFHLEFYPTHEHSGYYTVARNRSMEFVRGFYVAHMDADNEFAEGHLRGLLTALRVPDPEQGWPHFAYSRRLYVCDEGAKPPERYWYWDAGESDWRLHGFTTAGEPYPTQPPWDRAEAEAEWEGVPVEPRRLPEGPSPLCEWDACKHALMHGPKYNFIDTGDMLIPRSVLYMLAEKTGYVWDSNARRFADHDLVRRMLGCGFRGRAVDQVTNIYHWTGKNLQLTRGLSEIQAIPAEVYDKLKAEGKLT